MSNIEVKTGTDRLYVGGKLAANSALVGMGAGAATFGMTGLVMPAIVLAGVGGLLGYSMINEIPASSEDDLVG